MRQAVCFWLSIILATLCFAADGWTGVKRRPIEPRIAQQPIYWYERGVNSSRKAQRLWRAVIQ
ncbi:MAG: hypothetical protein JRF41_12935 [Deltaproteobacteria bacterium]|nr:hypothetical protein [Deltaproteobacteria bacterium]